MQARRFAVIGAGPSGLYATDRISRKDPNAAVDVFERLPTPFGLVRYGVAADHQGTKAVARVLERALARPNVRFLGNIEVGRDVEIEALRDCYDAVLIAVGATGENRLEIPGKGLGNVIGSGQLVNWLNASPDNCESPVDLHHVRNVVVVGLGNVAIDVARVFLKEPGDFIGSDLSTPVSAALATAPIEQVTIVGRGNVAAARFSEAELKELVSLPNVRVSTTPCLTSTCTGTTADILRSASDAGQKPLAFTFQATPVSFSGLNRVEAVTVREPDGSERDIPADLVITCIGYSCTTLADLPIDAGRFANEDNKIDSGLYVAGWAATGPRGTIATGRAAAFAVADRMLAETTSNDKAGLQLPDREYVDFEGWRRINEAEIAAAAPGRVREKIATRDEMLKATRLAAVGSRHRSW
ncbi:MAG: FAD-dependent oxidoreductase [Woeseia sp.]